MSQERTKLLNRSETSINKRSNGDKGKPLKIYPWRWVVLFVFSLNNAICNFIWLASSPIADVMKCYYNISDTILNFLPTTYLIVYPLFVFPAAWALDKYGIRMPTILSSAVMTIGSALRLAGTGECRYVVHVIMHAYIIFYIASLVASLNCRFRLFLDSYSWTVHRCLLYSGGFYWGPSSL